MSVISCAARRCPTFHHGLKTRLTVASLGDARRDTLRDSRMSVSSVKCAPGGSFGEVIATVPHPHGGPLRAYRRAGIQHIPARLPFRPERNAPRRR